MLRYSSQLKRDYENKEKPIQNYHSLLSRSGHSWSIVPPSNSRGVDAAFFTRVAFRASIFR